MLKSIRLLQHDFISPQQVDAFYQIFKREFAQFLKEKNCQKIEIKKGYFYLSGFFTTKNNQIYYWNIGDLRMKFGQSFMFYREAKSYKDFEGGTNRFFTLEALNEINIF